MPSNNNSNSKAKEPLRGHHASSPRPIQPDGGWGWVVCLTSMATNGTVFGIINCFGITFVHMKKYYSDGQNDEAISFKTSWIGSVCVGITFFMCMMSSIISDQLGIRPTAMVGGVLAAAGMIISAFIPTLEVLYLTYGLIMGLGFAFSYAPSMVILGHYFKKRMGLVNGLVTFGSSVFTMGLSLGLPKMFDLLGLRHTLLFLGGLNVLLIVYAATWKPIFTSENIGASQDG